MSNTISLVEISPFLGKVPRIYCDRADFRLFRPIDKRQDADLLRRCHGQLIHTWSPIVIPGRRFVHARVGSYRYSAYRPNWSFFSHLADCLGTKRIHFQKMEFALDWVVNTQSEADEMLAFAVQHLCIQWRGHALQKRNKRADPTKEDLIRQVCKRGWYFAERESNFNVVMYSDKPCRFSGGYCFHLEVRFVKSTLKRLFENNLYMVTEKEVVKLFLHRLRWMEPKSALSIGRADLGIDGRRKRQRVHIRHNLYRDDVARHGSNLLRANQDSIYETDAAGDRVSFIQVPVYQKILDDRPHLKKAFRLYPFDSALQFSC